MSPIVQSAYINLLVVAVSLRRCGNIDHDLVQSSASPARRNPVSSDAGRTQGSKSGSQHPAYSGLYSLDSHSRTSYSASSRGVQDHTCGVLVIDTVMNSWGTHFHPATATSVAGFARKSSVDHIGIEV